MIVSVVFAARRLRDRSSEITSCKLIGVIHLGKYFFLSSSLADLEVRRTRGKSATMPNVNNPLSGNQPPSMFMPEPMVVTIGLFVTMLFTLIGWLADKWKTAKKEAEEAKV